MTEQRRPITERETDLEQLRKTVEGLQAQLDRLWQQVSDPEDDPTGHEAGTAGTLDAAAKLERLNFYRREGVQEWTLLTNRVNSYIMSQAFLVSAYAAAIGNPDLRFRLLFPVIVSGIGLTASARAYPGIEGACKIIQLWHRKKEDTLADPCLSGFCDGRQRRAPATPYRKMVARLVARSRVGRRPRAGRRHARRDGRRRAGGRDPCHEPLFRPVRAQTVRRRLGPAPGPGADTPLRPLTPVVP